MIITNRFPLEKITTLILRVSLHPELSALSLPYTYSHAHCGSGRGPFITRNRVYLLYMETKEINTCISL